MQSSGGGPLEDALRLQFSSKQALAKKLRCITILIWSDNQIGQDNRPSVESTVVYKEEYYELKRWISRSLPLLKCQNVCHFEVPSFDSVTASPCLVE